MSKFNKSYDNFSINFILKGFTSILIGLYFLATGFFIKFTLEGFLIDNHPMAMMSPQIIEIFIFTSIVLLFLFSSLALFFSGRRSAKKFHYKLWNHKTKIAFWKYFFSFIGTIFLSIYLINIAFINYIAPCFLIMYGILLLLLKRHNQKNLLVLSLLSTLLGIVCISVPMYWYSSICILGIAHITFGVVVRK